MRFQNVCIEAVAHVLPSRVVPSTELEGRLSGILKKVGLPPGQLERLSGVQERRWWDAGTRPSVVSTMAAEKAMAKAGWRPQDVDGLVNASVSRDYLEPATSALVAGELGLGHQLQSFDVTNACVGFMTGMHVLANMIELGQVKRGLVVCAETVTEGCEATIKRLQSPDATVQDFRDNFATMTLGCGAAAFAMCHESVARNGHRLYGVVTRNAPEHNQLCLGAYHEMKADAHGLLVHGVGLAVETWPYAVREFGWEDPDSVDVVVGHQVSLAHFQSIFQKIGQPVEKALLTLPYLGNCGPTSMPLTLSIGVQQGQIREGQNVCLWAVGSGLGCAIMGVRW